MSTRWCVPVLALVIASSACGYVMSGTWEDDPKNWARAFGGTKPPDVVVEHSKYWRAPHWSYEAGYLFEIAPNEALRAQLFRENRLRKLNDVQTKDAERPRPCVGECPSWFAPGLLQEYDIFAYVDWPDSQFRLLVERKTGRMFRGDYQV